MRQETGLYSVPMVDYRSATSFGERIQLARKARGYRSARALADAVGSPNVTEAILQNIETGRYANVSLSQALNLAFTLKIPPSSLLAPIGRPLERVDLPGLSPGLAALSVVEFDAWLSGVESGAYKSTTADELAERTELTAFRDLEGLLRERQRLSVLLELEDDSTATTTKDWDRVADRLSTNQRAIDSVSAFLASAGWMLQEWIDSAE